MPHRAAITLGHHPYEITLHLSFLIAGVLLIVTGRIPAAASETMGAPVRVLWISLLIASGVVHLLGVVWRGQPVTGLRIELAGVLLLAGSVSMYAIAVIAVLGLQAAVGGTFLAGIAVGAWWRAGQILAALRMIKKARVVAGVPLLVESGDPP